MHLSKLNQKATLSTARSNPCFNCHTKPAATPGFTSHGGVSLPSVQSLAKVVGIAEPRQRRVGRSSRTGAEVACCAVPRSFVLSAESPGFRRSDPLDVPRWGLLAGKACRVRHGITDAGLVDHRCRWHHIGGDVAELRRRPAARAAQPHPCRSGARTSPASGGARSTTAAFAARSSSTRPGCRCPATAS